MSTVPVLETERLILRGHMLDDFSASSRARHSRLI